MFAFFKNCSNKCLSDAVSIDLAVDPNMGRFASSKVWERLIAVCPPNWTIEGGVLFLSLYGKIDSFSMMSLTLSSSRGSKYSLLLVSKSVDTVSGLEFIIMLAIPSSSRAHAA